MNPTRKKTTQRQLDAKKRNGEPIVVVTAYDHFSAKIVDAKTLGEPSTGQLIVRYVGYFISAFVFGLGFLWVLVDRDKL